MTPHISEPDRRRIKQHRELAQRLLAMHHDRQINTNRSLIQATRDLERQLGCILASDNGLAAAAWLSSLVANTAPRLPPALDARTLQQLLAAGACTGINPP